MGTLWRDVRFGTRMLLRRPGFSAAVVLMLALGIGVNAAIFSVFKAVLLQPLPYPDAERLVQVWEIDPDLGGRNTISPVNWADWRERCESFDDIAVYEYDPLTLTGQGEPRRLVGAMVSHGFFDILGVQPLLGRTFLPEEDRPGGDRVVVLSHPLWQRSFGGDPDWVGKSITLEGHTFAIVGVMPAGFAFPNTATQLWAPLAVEIVPDRRGNHYLYGVAKLAEGSDVDRAQAEIDAVALQLAADFPDTNANSGVELVPLHEETVGQARSALWILLAAVTLVLLIACANVANLLLARGRVRQREIAVRSALGAGRTCLVRQLLTESVLMALIAGALGALLAAWGVDLFLWLSGGGVPRRHEIGVDPGVFAFAFAISVGTGLLCGMAPALQATAQNVGEALKETSRGSSGGRRRRRAHGALVVVEVALALLLLVGGGLLARSFVRLQSVDPGFVADGLLTFQISLPVVKYPESHQQAEFFRRAIERVALVQGVLHAGATRGLPYAGSRSQSSFTIEGRPPTPDGPPRHADYRLASPGFFRAMNIPLLSGRLLEEGDDAGSAMVAVINETMAERFWPGEDPIGRQISPGNPPTTREIVGIVGDVKQQGLHSPPAHAIYVPYAQRPHYKMSLVARTRVEPYSLIPAIRRAVREIDPDQPIYGIATMQARLDGSIAPQRFSMSLLMVFAASALLLALVGVYGVLSYAVNERTHEIGIRMALGASRGDVLRLIVGRGLVLCGTGVAIGLLGALGLTRILAGMLFGVTPTDPVVLAGTSLLLVAAGLLASLLPALRAARVEPQRALRCE